MNWFNLSCDLLQQGLYFIIWTKGGSVLPFGNSGTHCLSFPAQTRNWLLIAFVGGCRIHGSHLPALLGIFPSNHTSHLNFFSPIYLLSGLIPLTCCPLPLLPFIPINLHPVLLLHHPAGSQPGASFVFKPLNPHQNIAITKDCKSKSILPTFVIPSASEF